MSNDDPLASLDQELSNLPMNSAGAGFGAPSTYTAGTFVTPQAPEWRVYIGSDTVPRIEPGQVDTAEGGRFARQRGTTKVPTIMGTDQANALWYSWSDADRKKWVDRLVERGMLDPEDPDLYAKAAQGWSDAVQEAGNFYTLGGKKVTPWQVVDLYSGSHGVEGQPTTSTESSVRKIDDLDARAAAEEAYSALMGRSAKGKEADAVKAALNAYAEAHPTISTRTSTTKNGHTDSSTVTTGGISDAGAKQIVEDQVRANPNYAEYQAATTNFNWLQQALGATADV